MFFLFSMKTYIVGTQWVPPQGTSDEYPQHMFFVEK